MLDRIRAYPMIVLLLPIVAAIFFLERHGILYPEEAACYDSLYIHTFVISGSSKATEQCERYEASTYGGNVHLYLLRDSIHTAPLPGDTVIARTRIRRVDSIGTFDYHKYLLRRGITGSAFIYRYTLKPALSHSVPLQERLYLRLAEAGMTDDEMATTGALTLGYKEDLDPELKRHFQASGAAHVLAVSGLHTGIIYMLLTGLLTLGGRYKPLYENRLGRCAVSTTIIAGMWGYAWLTGMTPSVVRAVVMVSVWETGKMLYRQANSLNTIASAAVLILLFRPLDLFSVSFQLSFTATFAIVVLTKRCEKLLFRFSMPRVWRKPILYIAGIIIVSIAAQLGTLPLTMYYFGQFSSYFLLTNLIVMPIAGVLVPCGLASIALGGSCCGIWFSKITYGLAWLMNHSTAWIESLPDSTVPACVGTGMVALYYVLFLLLCLVISEE